MEAKDLSKKYIYKVYKNSKDEFHCDKYPVIYVNKEYVYFKTICYGLDHIGIKIIHDELTVDDNFDWFRYYWNVDKSLLDTLQRNYKIIETRRSLKVLADNVITAAVEYQNAIDSYNKMAEALKKLEAEKEKENE